MKYTPDAQGYFSGQSGYGYRSIEAFVDAATQVRAGSAVPADFRDGLATVDDTVLVTAILEAGRRSLNNGGLPHQIEYATTGDAVALSVA
jgi:D-galacturonate reductase